MLWSLHQRKMMTWIFLKKSSISSQEKFLLQVLIVFSTLESHNRGVMMEDYFRRARQAIIPSFDIHRWDRFPSRERTRKKGVWIPWEVWMAGVRLRRFSKKRVKDLEVVLGLVGRATVGGWGICGGYTAMLRTLNWSQHYMRIHQSAVIGKHSCIDEIKSSHS